MRDSSTPHLHNKLLNAHTLIIRTEGGEMTQNHTPAALLALEIASCTEVTSALNDKNHPCNGVVTWQSKQWVSTITTIGESPMLRPEAWTGDITKAPIIFLSSNPSFNSKENYPNWQTGIQRSILIRGKIYAFSPPISQEFLG